MLPAVHFSTSSVLWALAAYLVAVAIHECGHWAVARWRGFQVVAVGFGCRRPWFAFSVLGTRLYVARPLTMGLTLMLYPSLRPPRVSMTLVCLGGAAANLLTALVVYGLFAIGVQHDFATSLFYISAVFSTFNLIPFAVERKGLRLHSDGGMALEYYRGSRRRPEPIGQQLEQAKLLADLCCGVGSADGLATYQLLAAMHLAELNAPQAARELRESIKPPSQPTTVYQLIDALLQFELALHEDPAAEPSMDPQLFEVWQHDATALAVLHLASARAAIAAGRTAVESARQGMEAARQSGYADLVTDAEGVLLRAELPDDLIARCEAILARTASAEASPSLKLALYGLAAERVAATDREKALALFRCGCELLESITASVQDEKLRAGYRQHLSQYLIAAQRELFEADTLIPAASSSAAPLKATRFTKASTRCATLATCLVLAGLAIVVNEGGSYVVYRLGIFLMIGSLVLIAAGFLLATLSTTRGQRSTSPTAANALALLLLFIVVTNLFQYFPWYRYAGLGYEATEAGDHAAAAQHFETALVFLRKRSDRYELADGIQSLADARFRLEDYESAEKLYAEVIEIQHELEYPQWRQLSVVHAQRARCLARRDHADAALAAYQESLEISRQHPDLSLGEFTALLDDYRALLGKQGRGDEAAMLAVTVGGIGLVQATE